MKKYVFVGNRPYILKNMLKKGLNITAVWVIKGSFLYNLLLKDHFTDFIVIENKKQLITEIEKKNFDVLISNGCPYILPIKELRMAKYINIHPSPLPDLRGKDPINAACLYDRQCGATCHVMDEGIDTGKIISQVIIPMTDDIEAAILYQLCFKAEVIAFDEAYKNDFKISVNQPSVKNTIYYSMRPEDRLIKFERGIDYILRQTRAYGYKSKGLYFNYKGKLYHFYSSQEVINPFARKLYNDLSNLQIAMVFENSVVIKLENRLLRFDQVENSYGVIQEGDFLESATDDMICFIKQ